MMVVWVSRRVPYAHGFVCFAAPVRLSFSDRQSFTVDNPEWDRAEYPGRFAGFNHTYNYFRETGRWNTEVQQGKPGG